MNEVPSKRLMRALELAWGLIANAGEGDWDRERPEWKEAAIRWRNEHWHPALKLFPEEETGNCTCDPGPNGEHRSWCMTPPPSQRTPEEDTELREQLAAIEHERWASWQRYMHSVASPNNDGSLTIPASFIERWERQITTPYAELAEWEKASDREQVDRYWPLVAAYKVNPYGE